MPSNDIIIRHSLPVAIVALQHSTLDEAMELCQRAHEIAIPSATLDEHGCRSQLAECNRLYERINELGKDLEAHRMERGREITALKASLDEAVKAATGPLNDQRARLGTKLMKAKIDLDKVIAEQRAAVERERLRVEAEQRAKAEAAERAEAEAKAKAEAAAEAARRAQAEADAAAAAGVAPLPDSQATLDAARAAEDAAAAEATAAAARTTALDASFTPAPQRYVAPAPKMGVKGRTVYSLAVNDLAKVPREIAGAQLWTLNESACLKLLQAGMQIPGLSLVASETTGAKGRSNAFAVG